MLTLTLIELVLLAIAFIAIVAYWLIIYPVMWIARHTSRIIVYVGLILGILGMLAYLKYLPPSMANVLISDAPISTALRGFAFAHGFTVPLKWHVGTLLGWFLLFPEIYWHIFMIFVQAFLWNFEFMAVLIGVIVAVHVIKVLR